MTTREGQEALEAQFNALPASFLTLTATTEREQSYEDPRLATGYAPLAGTSIRGAVAFANLR